MPLCILLLRHDPNIQILVIHPSFSKFARKRKEKKINERDEEDGKLDHGEEGKRKNDHRCSFPFETELSMKRDRERGMEIIVALLQLLLLLA